MVMMRAARKPKNIEMAFSQISSDYDSDRRKLIPCFDTFYKTAVTVAAVAVPAPRILDLGAGTGILTNFLRLRYPEAELTLLDVSEKMLAVAKAKLGVGERMHYRVGNYAGMKFSGSYDIIASALSIHHLATGEKRALFDSSYRHLQLGGWFVNADQVRGETPYWDACYKREWKQRIEHSGLPAVKISGAYERMKWDREDKLAAQLKWMKKAGFKEVACAFQWFGFAVMAGKKA